MCPEQFSRPAPFGHDGRHHQQTRTCGDPVPRRSLHLRREHRGFFIDEPDSLLGDRITRSDVTKFRVSQGWTQITTITLNESEPLGVIDVWTKSNDLE